MNLHPGDRIRVIKQVNDHSRTIRVGQVLEVIFMRKRALTCIYRCIDEMGRTRYIHTADLFSGHFERIFEAPAVTEVESFSKSERRELVQQIKELKSFQNFLAEQRAKDISMILESKRAAEKERDLAMASLNASSGHQTAEVVKKLKASMRDWLLLIQFSPQHAQMRKELQGYLKELESTLKKENHESPRAPSFSNPTSATVI